MEFRITDIEYDTDGQEVDLPTELIIDVPATITDEHEIDEYLSDEISNRTGFCHKGFASSIVLPPIEIGDKVTYNWYMFTSGTSGNSPMTETGEVTALHGSYVEVKYEAIHYSGPKTGESMGIRHTHVRVENIVEVRKQCTQCEEHVTPDLIDTQEDEIVCRNCTYVSFNDAPYGEEE